MQKQAHSRSRHGKRSPAAMPPVKRRINGTDRAAGRTAVRRKAGFRQFCPVMRSADSAQALRLIPNRLSAAQTKPCRILMLPPYFSPRPRVCLFRLVCMYGFTELVRQKPPPIILRFFPYVSPAPPSRRQRMSVCAAISVFTTYGFRRICPAGRSAPAYMTKILKNAVFAPDFLQKSKRYDKIPTFRKGVCSIAAAAPALRTGALLQKTRMDRILGFRCRFRAALHQTSAVLTRCSGQMRPHRSKERKAFAEAKDEVDFHAGSFTAAQL